MDRDYDVPQDVRPRLPEPPPQKRKQSALAGRQLTILGAAAVLVVVLITWLIIFAIGAGKTPAQAVGKAAKEQFPFQRELVHVSLIQTADEASAINLEDTSGTETKKTQKSTIKGERSVYFYVSNEQMACALLERRASGYKVTDLAGPLPLTGDGKPGIWMATGGGKEFLVFGLLYDPALTKVEVEGTPAVIVDTGRYRCWYFLGQGTMAINSESVIYK